MRRSGLRPDQASQVRGFADQRLRNLKNALDPSNRRISIIVQYINGNTDETESPDGIRKNGRREERREVKKRLAVEASPENCFVMQRVYVILLS